MGNKLLTFYCSVFTKVIKSFLFKILSHLLIVSLWLCVDGCLYYVVHGTWCVRRQFVGVSSSPLIWVQRIEFKWLDLAASILKHHVSSCFASEQFL